MYLLDIRSERILPLSLLSLMVFSVCSNNASAFPLTSKKLLISSSVLNGRIASNPSLFAFVVGFVAGLILELREAA